MTLLQKNKICSKIFFFASGKPVPVWCWEREVCPEANELPWALVSIIWWNVESLLKHHCSCFRFNWKTIKTFIQFDVWPPPAVVAWIAPQNGRLWSVTQKWAVWSSQWAHSSPEVPTRWCPHLLPTRAGTRVNLIARFLVAHKKSFHTIYFILKWNHFVNSYLCWWCKKKNTVVIESHITLALFEITSILKSVWLL